MPTLVWFREDLRITDNPALYHACRHSDDGVIGLYFITPNIWRTHHMAPIRVEFIRQGLIHLSEELQKHEIPLVVEQVVDNSSIEIMILNMCQTHSISHVFFNQQYEVNEETRDKRITTLLEKANIKVSKFHDQVIVPPGNIKTADDAFYKVFTPFKKSWCHFLSKNPQLLTPLRPISKQKPINLSPSTIPSTILNFSPATNQNKWASGENNAKQRLRTFVNKGLLTYDTTRDFPAINGTSQLSPYLSTGMISARYCLQHVIEKNNGQLIGHKSGVNTWINELIWRDFYKHILVAFPRVSKHRPFKLLTEKIQWDNNVELFSAWKQGKTGFPLVDAAMRQLNQIGWMHNRLRMLVAVFLTKLLLIDWRWGEQYFIENLIDGDLAANNGGWQWCASTGTDAMPYFRIFNPTTQSQKFDPDGKFIRHYCPELTTLDNILIHEPYGKNSPKVDYPQPIIDYIKARARALALFKSLG